VNAQTIADVAMRTANEAGWQCVQRWVESSPSGFPGLLERWCPDLHRCQRHSLPTADKMLAIVHPDAAVGFLADGHFVIDRRWAAQSYLCPTRYERRNSPAGVAAIGRIWRAYKATRNDDGTGCLANCHRNLLFATSIYADTKQPKSGPSYVALLEWSK
jgi:hypothetical protein